MQFIIHPYISLSNILLKSGNQDMDLGPSLHLNTGTVVDISNFEGYLPTLERLRFTFTANR